MNQLVTACLALANADPLVAFPTPLMNAFEKEVVDWILSYSRRHGSIPSIARMAKEYPHFLPIESEGAPLTDIEEQTLRRKRHDYAVARVAEIDLKLHEATDVPIDEMNKLMHVLSASASGLDKYSTFDRDLYFRRGVGLKLGFSLLDRAIGSIESGDYVLVVGRLAAGKSTITQWLAYQWWRQEKRILFISNEMMSEDVFARIDGMVGKFNPLLLRSQSSAMSLGPTLKVVRHIAASGKGEIIVPRARLMQPSQVMSTAEHLEVDAILIDGVHLMIPDNAAIAKWERVASVSNDLKQGALTLQRPLIGVTQLKRVGEKAEYDPEDIAYSDALGQDGDFVVAVRPSKSEKNVSELQMIKNRYGPLMTTRVRIDFDTMTVTDESVLVTATEAW